MSVIEITSFRLKGLVDNYLEAYADAGAPGPDRGDAWKADKGQMPEKFYIDNIQKTINLQFPWKELDMPVPTVPRDGVLGVSTKQALEKIKQVATEIKNPTALGALQKIESGDYHHGASELWDSAIEIGKILKTDDKYFSETGEDQAWDYQKKLQYMSTTMYPAYFPRPWQAKNMCSYVSGGDKYGKFTAMPSEEEFRSCQTPYFNHFFTWGPECPGCGINGSDPRYLRLKNKYPMAFSADAKDYRRKNHIWSPAVPSPGFAPYVAAPPEGAPYYQDPNNPHPETEGVRFFDAQDEKMYRDYMESYLKFKGEFGAGAEEYNKKFFAMLPHKKTKSRYKAPNEWSVGQYGREKPLWPDGTARPPAAELAKMIQERGLGTGPDIITSASISVLAEKFRKIY